MLALRSQPPAPTLRYVRGLRTRYLQQSCGSPPPPTPQTQTAQRSRHSSRSSTCRVWTTKVQREAAWTAYWTASLTGGRGDCRLSSRQISERGERGTGAMAERAISGRALRLGGLGAAWTWGGGSRVGEIPGTRGTMGTLKTWRGSSAGADSWWCRIRGTST